MNPASQPPTATGTTATPPRRRPWWVYLLWSFGTLAALAFALLASAWIYWNFLIRTYTSATPKTLPTVDATGGGTAELRERWEAYTRQLLDRREPIGPFELSGGDLNRLAAGFGPLRNQVHVEIRPPHLRVAFSTPLDRTGNPRLQGRHLNGIATLAMDYTDHRLALRVVALEANSKPVPGWVLRRLQATNWGDFLHQRPGFDLAIRALGSIELGTDRVVLHPAPFAP